MPTYSSSTLIEAALKYPIVLLPHPQPFNFLDRWEQPIWKQIGVYLWSIEHGGGYLVSYVGQTASRGGFGARIWQEYRHWESGRDRPVVPDLYLAGVRRELASPPPGYPQSEILALRPHLRLWLMPLRIPDECVQAERWLVARLCRHPTTRQFLANVRPEAYAPNSAWEVRIEAPPGFRVFGLTLPVPGVGS